MKRRKTDPARLKPGEIVVVWWRDSGLGTNEAPEHAKRAKLAVKETHGRVIGYDKDEKVLRLSMCSAGDDDDRSDIAVVWAPSIVMVWAFGRDKPNL